ncbi:MAG: molybdopterin-guanine dinucleotide biosynthesis protein MobB [Gemmatimonadales bacterium]|nr:molybdopterin-guanine dinucleotide biosynthesis protein MobB [Gemmatimonadales bacterium]
MRLISIVGHPRVGKTTLLAMLARELTRRGKRVAAIRAVGDPLEQFDRASDAGSILHEGQLDGFLQVGRGTRMLLERADTEPSTAELALRYFSDRDLVLADNLTDDGIPKIEVFRSSLGPAPLATTSSVQQDWIAVLSDIELPAIKCSVLRFTDTMWLQFLAALVWDRARRFEPS